MRVRYEDIFEWSMEDTVGCPHTFKIRRLVGFGHDTLPFSIWDYTQRTDGTKYKWCIGKFASGTRPDGIFNWNSGMETLTKCWTT